MVERIILLALAAAAALALLALGDVLMSRCPRLFLWIDQRVLRSRRRRETGDPWPLEIELDLEALDPFTPEQTRKLVARERARMEDRR